MKYIFAFISMLFISCSDEECQAPPQIFEARLLEEGGLNITNDHDIAVEYYQEGIKKELKVAYNTALNTFIVEELALTTIVDKVQTYYIVTNSDIDTLVVDIVKGKECIPYQYNRVVFNGQNVEFNSDQTYSLKK